MAKLFKMLFGLPFYLYFMKLMAFQVFSKMAPV